MVQMLESDLSFYWTETFFQSSSRFGSNSFSKQRIKCLGFQKSFKVFIIILDRIKNYYLTLYNFKLFDLHVKFEIRKPKN